MVVKKSKILILAWIAISLLPALAFGQINRQNWTEILLDDDFLFGEGQGFDDRDADHATVAMNSDRDVLVAFHSSRGYRPDDLDDPNKEWAGSMKQVEVALFEFTPTPGGIDRWTYRDTKVVGSVEYSPVPLAVQDLVKCERPDVVAVEDQFFVVWTRRYDHSFTGQSNQPAVLECAWVHASGNPNDPIGVVGHPSGSPGRGFEIDIHDPGNSSPFEVRECAGVVDAVKLTEDDDDILEVAVVYPHVVDPGTSINDDRSFELRVAKCEFDMTTNSITKTVGYPLIAPTVPFNGQPTPTGVPSPGLVLPDLAPSGEDRAFWLVYERQKVKPVLNFPDTVDGRIKLEYYKLDPVIGGSPGTWEQKASKTFKGSTSNWSWRRRPMISSYPTGSGAQLVSIAFSYANSMPNANDASPNVLYEFWGYDSGTLGKATTAVPLVDPWPNTSIRWDDRPLPLLGRLNPFVGACYATRDEFPQPSTVPTKLARFNPVVPSIFTILDTDSEDFTGVRRPAASYHHEPGATIPDYQVVTWEKVKANGEKRIFIFFE